MAAPRPLVGLPADTLERKGYVRHWAGDEYLRAVAEGARAIPLVIPALPDLIELDALLDRLDGIVLSGAASNVHPARYGNAPTDEHEPYDERRDALTLALIRRVLDRGMPLLAICRGFQELNVALGGTLEAEIQRAPGRLDHRAPPDQPNDVRYAPRHEVTLTEGGFLSGLLGKPRLTVNSLHRQGIARLGEGLVIEARASDGVPEAVIAPACPGFVLGTQWHPEWDTTRRPDALALFSAFGDAVARYAGGKARP